MKVFEGLWRSKFRIGDVIIYGLVPCPWMQKPGSEPRMVGIYY